MARIALLQEGLSYVGSDLHTRYIRGVENCTIRLARGFARAGHEVWGLTDDPRVEACDGVEWRPRGHADTPERFDLAIANNFATCFDAVTADAEVLWVHNPTKATRLLKKGKYLALLKGRQPAVMGSDDVRRAIPWTVPYASRTVIGHGVGDVFLARRQPRPAPEPVAVYLSMTYRGLDTVLEAWRTRIAPKAPAAKLVVIAGADDKFCDEARALPNVEVRDRFPDPEDLADFLATARVHLFPGHRDETFCNAAAECSACGVPLVTMGLGSLSERVIHEKTGFIETGLDAFGDRAAEILTDDALWTRLHEGVLQHPDLVSWDDRARQWADLFLPR